MTAVQPLKVRVWNPEKKTMSVGMTMPMLAGYLTAIYPKLGAEQFLLSTGMDDQDGFEIYQGDVLEYVETYGGKEQKHTVVVEWTDLGCDYHGGIGFPIGGASDVQKDNCLIIGNIYQNPELAK